MCIRDRYYSALGASDEKMLLARAIQMFMPGKPQVWSVSYTHLRVGKSYLFTFKYALAGTILVNVLSLIMAVGLNSAIRFKLSLIHILDLLKLLKEIQQPKVYIMVL